MSNRLRHQRRNQPFYDQALQRIQLRHELNEAKSVLREERQRARMLLLENLESAKTLQHIIQELTDSNPGHDTVRQAAVSATLKSGFNLKDTTLYFNNENKQNL